MADIRPNPTSGCATPPSSSEREVGKGLQRITNASYDNGMKLPVDMSERSQNNRAKPDAEQNIRHTQMPAGASPETKLESNEESTENMEEQILLNLCDEIMRGRGREDPDTLISQERTPKTESKSNLQVIIESAKNLPLTTETGLLLLQIGKGLEDLRNTLKKALSTRDNAQWAQTSVILETALTYAGNDIKYSGANDRVKRSLAKFAKAVPGHIPDFEFARSILEKRSLLETWSKEVKKAMARAERSRLKSLIDSFDKSSKLEHHGIVLACLYEACYANATKRLDEIDMCLDRLTIALEHRETDAIIQAKKTCIELGMRDEDYKQLREAQSLVSGISTSEKIDQPEVEEESSAASNKGLAATENSEIEKGLDFSKQQRPSEASLVTARSLLKRSPRQSILKCNGHKISPDLNKQVRFDPAFLKESVEVKARLKRAASRRKASQELASQSRASRLRSLRAQKSVSKWSNFKKRRASTGSIFVSAKNAKVKKNREKAIYKLQFLNGMLGDTKDQQGNSKSMKEKHKLTIRNKQKTDMFSKQNYQRPKYRYRFESLSDPELSPERPQSPGGGPEAYGLAIRAIETEMMFPSDIDEDSDSGGDIAVQDKKRKGLERSLKHLGNGRFTARSYPGKEKSKRHIKTLEIIALRHEVKLLRRKVSEYARRIDLLEEERSTYDENYDPDVIFEFRASSAECSPQPSAGLRKRNGESTSDGELTMDGTEQKRLTKTINLASSAGTSITKSNGTATCNDSKGPKPSLFSFAGILAAIEHEASESDRARLMARNMLEMVDKRNRGIAPLPTASAWIGIAGYFLIIITGLLAHLAQR